jgi:DNA-binding PadR family transcriptional regulator
MTARLRRSPQTLRVLELFLASPADWRYGYDISRDTGVKSGTLYPILMRLEDNRLLESSWETNETGRPPRHVYRLTRTGLQSAREYVRAHARRPSPSRRLAGAEG